MDSANKKRVLIVDASEEPTGNEALLFGNNAAWHCVLCDELNGDRTGDGEVLCHQCGKPYEILTAEGDSARGAAIGVKTRTMTAKELAQQLSAMAKRGAASQETKASFHLFGILYASEMDEGNITPQELVNIAGEKYPYKTEIQNGRKLASRVKIVRPL